VQDNPIHFPDLETQLYPVGLLDFCTQGHISQVDEGKDWSHSQLILKYMESCLSRVLPMLAASTANALQGNSGASWIAGHFGSMKKRFVPSRPPWEKQPIFVLQGALMRNQALTELVPGSTILSHPFTDTIVVPACASISFKS